MLVSLDVADGDGFDGEEARDPPQLGRVHKAGGRLGGRCELTLVVLVACLLDGVLPVELQFSRIVSSVERC
eukprot:5385682-Prymnesium_polylepis.1